MRPTDSRTRQRGTQLLEFAIALPLLLLLFFVVTEGAGLVRAHQVLNNAAREGSRPFPSAPAAVRRLSGS